MFKQLESAFCDMRQEAVHGQVECRVIIFNSFDELAYGNIRVELFFYFAYKRVLWCFLDA